MEEAVPEQLLDSLQVELAREPRINVHQHPVEVSSRDGVLVLDGRLESIAARKLALAAARRVAPEQALLDHLRVAASAPRGDDELCQSVTKHLQEEPVFRDYRLSCGQGSELQLVHDPGPDGEHAIAVSVAEGVVSLEGRVGSLMHRRMAEVLAWWTDGCELVHNRLHVEPPEQENDDELTDAVIMTLEKDPLVHTGQVSVRVAGGVVTLQGYVASDEERRLAELDAWYIPGVHEVDNRIETRSA